MRILKKNTGAIIVDVQERLVPHIYKNEELINNLERLIKGLKVLEIPTVVAEQYTKGLGFTVEGIHKALGKYKSIEKTSFSCCDNGSIKDRLSELNKKWVIVAGIEAHICVLQTVVDLVDIGYIPVLIEDCVSSRKENDKNIAIERMKSEGAMIATYESILFELCRHSGTSEFKAISQLVK
ncbi:hydrolase [Wukongibacter baidiensis]|uniref:hydrolase n=1 Tax=Wukongibacter baidiensis TaxID=1723361 RepID=UPI003D7F7AAF